MSGEIDTEHLEYPDDEKDAATSSAPSQESRHSKSGENATKSEEETDYEPPPHVESRTVTPAGTDVQEEVLFGDIRRSEELAAIQGSSDLELLQKGDQTLPLLLEANGNAISSSSLSPRPPGERSQPDKQVPMVRALSEKLPDPGEDEDEDLKGNGTRPDFTHFWGKVWDGIACAACAPTRHKQLATGGQSESRRAPD